MTTACLVGAPHARRRRGERVRVTLTDDHAEVDEALRLTHDGFVASGFMRPRPSGRRMIAPFLNPGTTFALARVEGVLRGTVALVADGPFGLPAGRAFAEEIDALRAAGPRVFEIGSLTLDPRSPRLRGPVMWALVAALVRLQLAEHPGSPNVVAVSPSAERFYRSIAGLRPATPPRPLLGAPAILMHTTAREAAEGLIDAGGGASGPTRMSRLVHGGAMGWLRDRRRGAAWPAEWLEPMLDEIDLRRRPTAQARRVLGGGEWHPGRRPRLVAAAPA